MAAKKKIADTKGNMVGTFLKQVLANPSERECGKLVKLLAESGNRDDIDTVQKVCEVIGQIADTDEGFFAMYRTGTLETLTAIQENMDGVQLDVKVAYNAMVQRVAHWLSAVDHVEFFKLPQVLELATRFAAEYVSVAIAAVATLDRFAMQQVAHRVTILSANGLNLIHKILSAHRSPEFCQETLVLLFHVCDVPAENVKPMILKELSLIKSVVETLDQAPVNMRLQIAGLRLLTLWQNYESKKINEMMREAGAYECFRNACDNVSKAGFTHAAAWLDTIGGAAFEEKAPTVQVV